jgi:hypothetical protein
VTEEYFRNLECVRHLLDAEFATLQFYPADLIGDTAAPSSAMAIVTIFDLSLSRIFLSQIAEQRFVHPLQPNPIQALIELAPLQRLPLVPQGSAQTALKQLAPIEEDPEFMQFAKDYDVHHVPPGDQLLSREELELIEDEIDDTGVLNYLNDRMEQGAPRKRGRGRRRRGA